MTKIVSLLDDYFEEVLSILALSMVAGCVFLQVIMRFIFDSATTWAEELAVYGMIFAIYLGASMAVKERSHIRITIVVQMLPRRLQVLSIVLADFLWFSFVIFLIVQTLEYSKLLFEVTYITPGLGIEQRWIQIFLPLMLSLMAFRILQVYWRWAKSDWKDLPL